MSIVDIKVPPMGESITEVTLAKWLKKEGDFINMDEPICEFESDKATLDLPAEASGQLQIIAKAGSDLKIGEVIARINKDVSAPVTAEAPIEAKA
ncbi:MAG: dihydrolipoyllysine-residue succinyltransferase, partial [Saprospiraceae bacterium]|nr:dihydrolipoyllysine-residue succinyltransferase [Saprospiraceae bacterium]